MKARLDHIGIAVADIGAALAFFRDALGLDVEPPEEVPTEQVRAHMVPVGEPRLELLEPTSADSTIATFVARRGGGLHHVTLTVDDLDAVLARLRERGVRLVNETPRPGAEGSRIAFVHPSAAAGVLLELREDGPPRAALDVKRVTLGDLQLTTVHDGLFRLDGGAMFGVVPRSLWEAASPPDGRNRILLATRPLLVEASWGRMLVDCGLGDRLDAKQRAIYAVDRTRHLDHALADAGHTVDDIDVVLATHLHFDHMGGSTVRREAALVPRFPRARYAIRRAEWHDATHTHERNRASYHPDDFLPLEPAGVVDFFDGDQEIRPGVRVVRTGGHTGQHQIVVLESGGRTAVFLADLVPTTAHVETPWIMGYDLFPMETLEVKKRVIQDAIDGEHLVFFEHDPLVAAGYIRERGGKRYVEQVL